MLPHTHRYFHLNRFFKKLLRTKKSLEQGEKIIKLIVKRFLLTGSIYQTFTVKNDILSVLRTFILILFNFQGHHIWLICY